MTAPNIPKDPDADCALDQAVWTVARRLVRFSFFSLAADAHVRVETASALVRRWREAGAVAEDGTGFSGRLMFRVSRDAETTPSRVHRHRETVSAEQAMWIAMRRARAFMVVDIAAMVSSEDREISNERVRAYCQTLLNAGYLQKVQRKGQTGKPEAFRLVRDTGPNAPTTRRMTVTVDNNTNAVVFVPQVQS